ncbi:MAG: hypothetical protein ABJ388_16440 [Alphaproteobacteria bacterium]|uniref:hypothetical protein n=1 Tax=Pseudomonadota TaxID=1224 RepID=UPI0032651469
MDTWIVLLVGLIPLGIIVWVISARHKAAERQKFQQHIASAPERFAKYDRMRLTPEVGHNLNLQNGEACYWIFSATMYAFRSVRGTVGYHGPVVRIPIAKGLTYRAALYSGAGQTEQELRPVSRGELYLTNKRVIFRGDKKNNSVAISKVLSLTYFYGDDSVRIDKDNGPPIILDGFDGELFYYLYKRVSTERFYPVEPTAEWMELLGCEMPENSESILIEVDPEPFR